MFWVLLQIHFPVLCFVMTVLQTTSSLLSEGLLLVSINRRNLGKECLAEERRGLIVYTCVFFLSGTLLWSFILAAEEYKPIAYWSTPTTHLIVPLHSTR